MTDVGMIIKSIRKQNGLSQKEFGKALTVSQSYICKVETGKEIPTDMFIKLFCLLYSVDKNTFDN